jgi:CBS domain-containing protein
MTTIDQLLKLKGHDFHAVSPTETVYAAIKLMADRNVGSVLVIEGGALIGIVTERHYAREVALKGRTSPKTLVRDIMDKHVPCVSPGQSVEACLALMTDKRVRHLPVLERRRVVGLVSSRASLMISATQSISLRPTSTASAVRSKAKAGDS